MNVRVGCLCPFGEQLLPLRFYVDHIHVLFSTTRLDASVHDVHRLCCHNVINVVICVHVSGWLVLCSSCVHHPVSGGIRAFN